MAKPEPTRTTNRRTTTQTPDSYGPLGNNEQLDPKTQAVADRYLHGQRTNPDGSAKS